MRFFSRYFADINFKVKAMEKELADKLREDRIRAMENPIVYMNYNDFTKLKENTENIVINFTAGGNPTFMGVPIISSSLIHQGSILVFDSPLKNGGSVTELESTVKQILEQWKKQIK